MNVTIKKFENMEETYCRYDRQTAAQSCYVYVDLDCRDGVLTASYNAKIGYPVSADMSVVYGRRYWIPLLKPTAVNDFLESLRPLAQRVVDGYESVWDNGNLVAQFKDDAFKASEEIAHICDDYVDYVEGTPKEDNIILTGVGKYIDGLRQQCRVNVDDDD